MTEDEAKTKWCPISFGYEGRPDTCAASDCMWWVWDESMETMKERVISDTEGHCGAIK